MNKKDDFVDGLMDRAFQFKAPEMPDFAGISKEDEIMELDIDQLDQLAAAGGRDQAEKMFRELITGSSKTGK